MTVPGVDPTDADRVVARTLERLQKQFPIESTRHVNCVLVGRPGNGKSSLINSLYQTLTGRTDRLCDEGKLDASCTLKYACSPALVIQRAAPLVLFDTKGLPDAKDRPTRTLLHNLLRGKFKPDHSMSNPRFQDCYLLPQKALQIDVAVFVYAYGSVFPHRLATALQEEAKAQGVTVVPVITFYDQVEDDEQLGVHLDCCRRTFNTHPLYLANLSAFPAGHHPTALALSRRAVVDVASQLMVYGQQHQRFRRLDIARPVDLPLDPKECSVM
jgi:GTPase SAR1 family protein